jgi:peptide/nickel transport system ATP-binding protein
MTQVAAPPALELSDLEVAYRVRGIWRPVLRGVSFSIGHGESYGLVGESGCGKSTAAYAVLRYLPRNGRISSGSVSVAGEDLAGLDDAQVRALRASKLSMVYQNPGGALNPTIRIGDQVSEVYAIAGVNPKQAPERAREILAKVQISDPDSVMRRYPHQLSGGMQQRVVIAMALAKDPELLILDEPTTGLDATVEAEVLELVAALRDEYHTSVLFISHNLDVIAKMCERVGVLYAGRLVEEGPVDDIFHDPRHPYTVGLLRCLPRGGVRKDKQRLDTIPGFLPQLGADLPACVYVDRCGLAQEICSQEEPPFHDTGHGHSRCHFWEQAHELPRGTPAAAAYKPVDESADPVIRAESLNKTFRQEGHDIRAVDDLNFVLRPGETLGLVGESGSGKTTLARTLLGLIPADDGSIIELDGVPLEKKIVKRGRDDVRALQIVFQNPDSALNRRFSVQRILGRALEKLRGDSGREREEQLRELAHSVRFDVRLIHSRPGQLSGGLKQRVAIARAFAGEPRVVVCDEPTSALDVSVQAAILNLLAELQADKGVTYLFISHDLGVVRYLSDRIAVLYLGRLMELADAETVFNAPHHPYTEALLSSIPQVDGAEERERIRLHGEIPSHANPPSGCVFHTRCPRYIGDVCWQQEPELKEVEPGHFWRCHYSVEELRELQKTAPPERRDGAPGGPEARDRAASEAPRPEADTVPPDERRPTGEGAARSEPLGDRPRDAEGRPGAGPGTRPGAGPAEE